MSQYFPNLVTKNARPDGIGAPIQTKDQAATGTGSAQFVAITFDAAYQDTNFGVQISVETVSGDGSTISVGGFTKSKTGISVSITGANGQSLLVHVLAHHAGPGAS